MTDIVKIDSPAAMAAATGVHPSLLLWTESPNGLLYRIRFEMQQRNAHPARTVVLLPYAQLMPLASRLWSQCFPDGFSPRFETTLNWSTGLRAAPSMGTDIAFDMALDVLTAGALLRAAGMASQQDALAGLLVQAAHQLAPLAAARAPNERGEWAAQARRAVLTGLENPALAVEAAIARVAVEWVAQSDYSSDALFDPALLLNIDCLLVVQGFAADAMLPGLQRVWGDRLGSLTLVKASVDLTDDASGHLSWHACSNAEDEAQRVAACAIDHIAQGRYPLALVSTDRALTRRVRTMLEGAGVQIRDENGWKLSTSHVAARVMATLKAAKWDASADAVIVWLKTAPAFASHTSELEACMRRDQASQWRGAANGAAVRASPVAMQLLVEANSLRDALQGNQTLEAWLLALRQVLQCSGIWDGLHTDDAGKHLVSVLRLQDPAPPEWGRLLEQALWSKRRMDLNDFTAWVNHALEGASFSPPYPHHEQVVILPLNQMLARPFAAVVLAGCDEVRLNPSPEPPGGWTSAQRAALGLPSRDDLQAVAEAAWRHALQTPWCDVLWRCSDENGESLLPSTLVQRVQLDGGDDRPAADPRSIRSVAVAPVPPPQPVGQRLPVRSLSASAYEDLRTCPYRFFAQRQLGLRSADELEVVVDKRDFGVWLHAVLKQFHESVVDLGGLDLAARLSMLESASLATTQAMGLGDGEFLPFAAAWPAVRDGYLRWLSQHEATGAVFSSAETAQAQRLGDVTLVGRIDRIDRLADGVVLVLDYKTENAAKTAARVKEPLEDTQLAFYAALLSDDVLQGAYVHVGERDGTRAYHQSDIVQARDALVEGIQLDMTRIRQGAVLPALGDGAACDFCQVRGLCRKDFWEPV